MENGQPNEQNDKKNQEDPKTKEILELKSKVEKLEEELNNSKSKVQDLECNKEKNEEKIQNLNSENEKVNKKLIDSKSTIESLNSKLDNKNDILFAVISIVTGVFLFSAVYLGHSRIKNQETFISEEMLVNMVNGKENTYSDDTIGLEKKVIDYQFALSFYEYKNSLATRRVGLMIGSLMFYIGFVQILFVLITKDVKTNDYFAVKALLNVSMPGVFLAFLGTLTIVLSLIFVPSRENDYSPKFLRQQPDKELLMFQDSVENRSTSTSLDSISK